MSFIIFLVHFLHPPPSSSFAFLLFPLTYPSPSRSFFRNNSLSLLSIPRNLFFSSFASLWIIHKTPRCITSYEPNKNDTATSVLGIFCATDHEQKKEGDKKLFMKLIYSGDCEFFPPFVIGKSYFLFSVFRLVDINMLTKPQWTYYGHDTWIMLLEDSGRRYCVEVKNVWL